MSSLIPYAKVSDDCVSEFTSLVRTTLLTLLETALFANHLALNHPM